MPSTHHHVGVRVTDLERSERFYADVFGAHRLMDPIKMDGDLAQMVFAAPNGTVAEMLPIGFPDGGAIELFHFLQPAEPSAPIDAWRGNILHFAVQVDDVAKTLAAADAAGAERFFPEIFEFDDIDIMFVKDPDGNLIEIIDATFDHIVAKLKTAF